tara:strand:- start:375 stop:539 length:165 start_codon:yes stop_codon:yes gene_type:complete
MTTTKLTQKQKVEAKLLKGGFNQSFVDSMMNEHYDYANTYYSGVAKIANVISSL